ncbi:hypothetical protein GCM10011577_27710 [Pseudarthrobacter polychromogenes]|uniref:Uncharacterized protein n=1 Tax=Pseudarthrobacter polychromogenes TaxID=1676 RepID=A0ABQ1XSY0_9MICC|nr:hypothetical protein GCM10011577_27710 [Pseudarthrobacter polychromogenes]
MRTAQKQEIPGAVEAARAGFLEFCRGSAWDHTGIPQRDIGGGTGQLPGQGRPGNFRAGHGVSAYDDAPLVGWQCSGDGKGGGMGKGVHC